MEIRDLLERLCQYVESGDLSSFEVFSDEVVLKMEAGFDEYIYFDKDLKTQLEEIFE